MSDNTEAEIIIEVLGQMARRIKNLQTHPGHTDAFNAVKEAKAVMISARDEMEDA